MESNDYIFLKNNLDKHNFRDTFNPLSQIPIKMKVSLLVTLLKGVWSIIFCFKGKSWGSPPFSVTTACRIS